ncbi:DUF3761 domain-containing protein [Methylobacterium sp. E-046]|uniref:DUF3761 domain-containing protein n=1 Tax=Methylobacterium sp. E-046 TaxID=2836576 RepID=UPI001FBBC6A4|nr:DUF3761 domain-containing protein [Methylobacterium sp. E-046]MCJ2097410.1 DUF3761 domain-containing protein [Methylobacterium sp. E-046]
MLPAGCAGRLKIGFQRPGLALPLSSITLRPSTGGCILIRAALPLLLALVAIVALLGLSGEASARGSCKLFAPEELKHGTYTNRDGCEVPRPEQPQGSSCTKPADATARCRDGDWSFSQHRQGTCSHHRGVGCWVAAGHDCC